MSMLYIWWVVIVVMLAVLLIAVTMPIAVGQYRLQALSRLCQYVAVAVAVTVLTQIYHPLMAILVGIILVLLVMVMAHTASIRRHTAKILKKSQPSILRFVSRHSFFEYMSDKRALSDKVGVSSRDELLAIVHGASFMPESHRRNIASYVPLLEKQVSDFMRPISDIVAIQEDDVIGPLLLHDLHNTGQHSFLVVAKSGEIKGTVKLTQLTESSKEVTEVQDIMDRHLVRIPVSASAQEAFFVLVREQVWLGVVSDAREPSVVSLQDIAGALLGKVSR